MRKKMTLASVAGVATITLALAACGGGSGSNDGGGGGGDDGDDQTLTVWAWDPAFNVYAMNEAATIYAQDNPDVTVEVIETPWEDIQTKLTTLAQTGELEELPDIFLMQNNAFQKNLINYPELFTAITDSGIDFAEFPESVVAFSTTEGDNYGVPFDNGAAVTALRTDILAEAGYTIEDFTDITWDEFIANGEDILAQTGKPLLSGTAGESDLITMILQSTGGSLFDADGNPTITDNDALLQAIDVYTRLVESGVLVEVNSWDEYIGTFVNSNVAGTINGVWILGSIQTAADQSGLWNITNLPSLDGVGEATNYSANGGSSWVVSSNANTELAADFLGATFAGSTEFYDTILPSSGAIANWIPASESDVYAEPHPFFADQPVFQLAVEFGAQVPSVNTGAYYYEGRDAVSAAITNILNGADPESALAEAQATVEFAMQ
ncbi:ABC transporter substrate-binding protein [Occultella gossypii]|uniref:Extracellular solute-binding protein n=1 Tax=Occultella gossypii TaxID=2800820 RepID=A0ABS7SCM7_9MICO|nr:extracellular solute-binding protein [Occultella gossypii]MBZ2198122.1 extracellular solute-binding protein [Occultella gossypii]